MQFHYLRMEHHILQDARRELGITMQQTAERANLTLRQYQRYESGEYSLSSASFDKACRVLKALELDITAFANGDYVFSEDTIEIPLDEYEEHLKGDTPISSDVFLDKICVLIGRFERYPKAEAADKLFAAGGVADRNLSYLVSYVITGKDAENTKIYKEARKLERKGFAVIITEDQFYDALEGKFVPPENPNKNNSGIVVTTPATDSADEFDFHDVVTHKRMKYLASKKILAGG